LAYATAVLRIEAGSVSDNPIVLPGRGDADDEIAPVATSWPAGGGGHGHHHTALVSLASISERRLYRLLDPKQNNDLPAFLVHGSGLNPASCWCSTRRPRW
jgi:histidine ammonia-lyase